MEGKLSFYLITDSSQTNASVFNFIGTNSYWLPALNTEKDIDNTLASISAANFTVVRTWAFNGSVYY